MPGTRPATPTTCGSVTDIVNGFGETTTFTYDGVGKLKTQTNQNGTSTTYTYNQNRGWPTQILHKLGSTPFASYDLEYDDGNDTVGNITKVTELDSSEVGYTYDALTRLTAEARTGTGPYTRTYGYDLAGNMTAYSGSTFATYDDANKISSLSGGTVSYDADGNLATVAGAGVPSTTLTWDARNRLKRQQTSTNDLTYGYDYSGRRVLRYPTGTTSTTFYVFSGEALIGEVNSGTPSYTYTWGTLGLISQMAIASGDSFWFHFGPQSETRHITDQSGSVSSSYRYDGYGRATHSGGGGINAFRYGGQVGYYSDGDSGLMLATYRWYSPDLSRWTIRDPIEYRGGDNLFTYVEANPISFTDSLGLKPGWNTYPSLDEAGRQGANIAVTLQQAYYGEWGGLICYNARYGFYCRPPQTTWRREHIKIVDHCEAGEQPVGWYHSHPRAVPNFSAPSFSDIDRDSSDSLGLPGYLGTDSRTQVYTPAYDSNGNLIPRGGNVRDLK